VVILAMLDHSIHINVPKNVHKCSQAFTSESHKFTNVHFKSTYNNMLCAKSFSQVEKPEKYRRDFGID